jgi:hypothetical protein
MGAPERCVHGKAAASNNDGVAPVVTDECGEVQRGGTTRRARIKREREREGGPGRPADGAQPTAAQDRRARAEWRGHAAQPAEQGWGKGADRWAVTTVSGGSTG